MGCALIGAVAAFGACYSYNHKEIDQWKYSSLTQDLARINSKSVQKAFDEYYADRVINNWEYTRMNYKILKHREELVELKTKAEIEKYKKEMDVLKTNFRKTT